MMSREEAWFHGGLLDDEKLEIDTAIDYTVLAIFTGPAYPVIERQTLNNSPYVVEAYQRRPEKEGFYWHYEYAGRQAEVQPDRMTRHPNEGVATMGAYWHNEGSDDDLPADGVRPERGGAAQGDGDAGDAVGGRSGRRQPGRARRKVRGRKHR